MTTILRPGDRIHLALRRIFSGEPRRHFVGTVHTATEQLARVDGWPWLFDPNKNVFVRAKEKRTRIISLLDAGNILHLLPPEVDADALRYQMLAGAHYVITDGKKFQMDVNEFGTNR